MSWHFNTWRATSAWPYPKEYYLVEAESHVYVVTEILYGGAVLAGAYTHSFPFQLNLSSSVHRITQLNT
jgi:hypothetical protein